MIDPDLARSIIEDPSFKLPGGFTIRRWTVITDQDGMGVKTYIDIPAEGAVVPSGTVGEFDVNTSPEFERQSDAINVYTTTPILTGDSSTYKIADHIIYNGASWRVTDQNGWDTWGFNSAVAILIRQGQEAV